jgi:hypothetical protein
MHKIIGTLAVVGLLAVPASAMAGNAGDGSGYGTQPGYEQSLSNTPCAGHGAFGAFGKNYNLSGGADNPETGLNNALLCGNRQGNLS